MPNSPESKDVNNNDLKDTIHKVDAMGKISEKVNTKLDEIDKNINKDKKLTRHGLTIFVLLVASLIAASVDTWATLFQVASETAVRVVFCLLLVLLGYYSVKYCIANHKTM